MSQSAINRSLNNIRNELDFLRESNVISEGCFKEIMMKLPSNGASPVPPPMSLEYVEALYDFQPQQDGDLAIRAGDKIQVLEKPSAEWYRGTVNGREGMFPSNYVRPAAAPSANLAPPAYDNPKLSPQPTVQSFQPPAQPIVAQPSPQPAYYQAPPQQVVVEQQPVQQSSAHNGLKSFGSKLGNAAIFGAGATLGSDLVNSIF
ncbi:uncharacterized protein GVI51_F04455 [Nakaseomyces glabratus]|uniref:SH3 domain-containing protein n=2 Tax=Candida glabrata TaxID=5478 RepID=Q6FUB3_CANGA|nr:uncharacterized protein CAGL0F04829g [Nakaseomyces glabratus]KAH7587670.1 SH3 domain [Nakaseomyces glabratus]KAH7594655.1 SH3 domain [Nakaseomyces glabratus]KAH7604153.1 SH3 domain [Nakaseomyces glabratus]KAH7605139.1 SH3 domain [Nakaseomyces glabratus]KAH7607455.1 SH3 domain [Nakaseomyces glabratus]|eukprot:XP_446181.1 uncharacterized protein CAGL0F04829g [[Candida] glabrata]